jgi:hypothetical protein
LALQTPKFYFAGSKKSRKSGFLRAIDRKNQHFKQALKQALTPGGLFQTDRPHIRRPASIARGWRIRQYTYTGLAAIGRTAFGRTAISRTAP